MNGASLQTDLPRIIELAKFCGDRPRELRTPFEKWLHVLKFGELYEDRGRSIPEVLREEEGIEMAVEKTRQPSASEQVREMIEFRRKAEHDEATRLESARLDGLEKGRQEGREEGERKAAKALARKMREAGMDTETTQRITGVRPEDLD